MGKEITGIASEFYVLSMLLRKGADATFTLGNKKNIDIFVNKDGKAFILCSRSSLIFYPCYAVLLFSFSEWT